MTKASQITVYTTPGCRQCKLTLQLLTTRGFTPEVVDLENKPLLVDAFTAQGFTQAPVVEVTSRWSGFRPDLINQLEKEKEQR